MDGYIQSFDFSGATEHKKTLLNISIGATHKKRMNNPNLTNERIREIYDLKDKMLQKEVSLKYNAHRDLIRNIWNKKIIPTDDENFVLQKQELIEKSCTNQNIDFNQKISIGKRTLEIDECIEIIKWKIKKIQQSKEPSKEPEKQSNEHKKEQNKEKIFSTKVSEYLTKLWKKKITNDMIKNIWSGRTKLFEFEFENKEITYQEYKLIIEKEK
jgi:hypothetical protein